jgi:hypothetical protein
VKEPCIKRQGPRTEELLNPEWGIVIPDDCKVDPEDAMAYHYAFSDDLRSRGYTYSRLWKKFRAGFGGFIPCASLRHEILAYVYFEIDAEERGLNHHAKAKTALRKLSIATIGDGDLMAAYMLACWSNRTGRSDEAETHQNGIVLILNSLDWKERCLGQASNFAVLRPYFRSTIAAHGTLLVHPPDHEQLATVGRELFNYSLDSDFFSENYNPHDFALWRHLLHLGRALSIHLRKRSKRDDRQLYLTPMVAIIEQDLGHPRFDPIVDILNGIVVSSNDLPHLTTLRCFRFLLAKFWLRFLKFGTILEALEACEMVLSAWQLVRFILRNEDEFDCMNPKMAKFALFLGSCLLPSCAARDASISPKFLQC